MTANTGRTFYSRNVATATFHPQLSITYAIPEPNAALLALVVGVVGLSARATARLRRLGVTLKDEIGAAGVVRCSLPISFRLG